MSLEQTFKRGVSSLLRLFLRSRVFPPPEASRIESILVVRQHNQLGDMLCVVPLLRALRAKYPHARISLMTSPVNDEIMRGNRFLDEVILYDKRAFLEGGRFHLVTLLKFIRTLRKRSFSVAIIPSTVSMSFTSELLAYLSGAPCRIGAGTLNGIPNKAAFLLTSPHVLDWNSVPNRHQTLRNLDNAAVLGLGEVEDLSLEITLSEEESEAGRSLVQEARQNRRFVIGYHPGAGKPPNRWPVERFAEVIERLSSELDAGVVLTCGPMDLEVVKALESRLDVSYYLVKNQSIRAVASVLRSLNLVIANDTGIMHVAAAVGVPVLSLFGPTSPEQWAPQGLRHRYIRGENGDIGAISLEKVIETAKSMICS